MPDEIALSLDDLREVAGYAAQCAAEVLTLFEARHPDDLRPRQAIEAARAFANGGPRVKALRDAAWAALKAAGQAEDEVAEHAARAAMAAPSAAFLHPLAQSTQVKHILGSSAHAARARELVLDGAGEQYLAHAAGLASAKLVEILCRYPPAPSGGGRIGALLRELDQTLRNRA